MKNNWFVEYKWIYYPTSWQGVFVTILVALFNIQVFFIFDSKSHSITDTLCGIFPYLIGSLVILYWVASKASRKKK